MKPASECIVLQYCATRRLEDARIASYVDGCYRTAGFSVLFGGLRNPRWNNDKARLPVYPAQSLPPSRLHFAMSQKSLTSCRT